MITSCCLWLLELLCGAQHGYLLLPSHWPVLWNITWKSNHRIRPRPNGMTVKEGNEWRESEEPLVGERSQHLKPPRVTSLQPRWRAGRAPPPSSNASSKKKNILFTKFSKSTPSTLLYFSVLNLRFHWTTEPLFGGSRENIASSIFIRETVTAFVSLMGITPQTNFAF